MRCPSSSSRTIFLFSFLVAIFPDFELFSPLLLLLFLLDVRLLLLLLLAEFAVVVLLPFFPWAFGRPSLPWLWWMESCVFFSRDSLRRAVGGKRAREQMSNKREKSRLSRVMGPWIEKGERKMNGKQMRLEVKREPSNTPATVPSTDRPTEQASKQAYQQTYKLIIQGTTNHNLPPSKLSISHSTKPLAKRPSEKRHYIKAPGRAD